MAENRRNPPDAPPPLPKKAASRAGWLFGSLKAMLGSAFSNPYRAMLTLLVNAAVVVGIVSTANILHHRKPPPKPVTMELALIALDRGNAAEAQRMAARLAADKDITTENWGGPDFILGTLAAREAEGTAGKERPAAFRIAALYLQRSRERGFPEHREPAGLYLLGKSLCLCGRLTEALPMLEQALPLDAMHASEIRFLLIEARMGVQPPELDKALAENQKLLAEPQLDDSERRPALIQRAQILIRMDRTKECAAIIEKIPDSPLLRSDIWLLRGWLALREGQALKKSAAKASDIPKDAKEKFRLALELFRKALSQEMGDSRAARQASYLIGLCLMEQFDLPAALIQMERTARFFPDTDEAQAAFYQQGEIGRRMGRHEEAVSAYKRLLSSYARQDEFHNPWIDLAQMKATLLRVCKEYLQAGAYNTALDLSQSLVHLLPKMEALQLTAHIYQTWGDTLLEQAEHLPPAKAEDMRKQARAQLRHAGDAYAVVARELFTTRQYPDELWSCASAYFAGHDFKTAAEMLKLYTHHEARLRHAQALVDLGESRLSLGETKRALEAFQECIQQHPRDVAIYRARLLASRAALMLGDLPQAEAFLQANLSGDQLTPASKEWRDSLFAMGELLHNAGRDGEAIPQLELSLERYPDAPQATVARYLLADSSRRHALKLRSGLSKEVSSSVRSERASDSLRLLNRALEAYIALGDNLSRRNAEELTEQEKAVLRNVRFAVGDTYVELQRYPEALRAYQSAANHYATSPEVLDAYLQMANVYRRMDRPAEARTSLEQARIALRRIPPAARFDQTTNYDRKQWSELLDRLCSL